MTHAHHPGPVVLTPSGQPVVLKKLSFLGSGDGATFDEDWLQNTLFTNPDVLPILDIDSAYKGCIPVCRELNTRAGPLDLLYVTPSGRLVVVETKLWRNAEARRTVISQTLDYASQLAKWSFDDLTREVCRARKEPAGALIDLVRRSHPEINERDFADQISLTLRTGRFLLLIVGDGIREGVHALTDFLDRYAMLEFSFGLIEIGVYEHPAVGRLIFPRPLAKTAIVKRSVITIDRELIEQGVVLRDTGPDQEAPEDIDQEVVKRNAFYLAFWSRFLGNLEIQDTTQPKAKESKWENIYFYLPPSGSVAWVSAYFSQSKKEVGVYLRLTNSEAGKILFEALKEQREQIEQDLVSQVLWTDRNGKYGVSVSMPYDDLLKPVTLSAIEEYFTMWVNRFISTFRPRLSKLSADLGLL